MVKTKQNVLLVGGALAIATLLLLSVSVWAVNMEKATHPETSEQEMLISCAECHKEATPEIEKQWYDSVHGIAMVKCYQCHGTFETFKVTPDKADCATCHVDQLTKCSQEKECWECHVPHSFKAKK